ALVALVDAIAEKGAARPTILSADVARTGAAQEIAEALQRHGLEPEVIVNNAGAGLTGAADKLDRALSSSRSSTSTCARSPICRSPSSTASNAAGAGRAVYYASKAYVLSFSEALHRELKPPGVRVTVLCPGPVPTALQARAGMTGFLPRLFMRSAEEVAREAYRGLSQGRRMVVPGFANRAVTTAIRLSPRSLWLELIARQQRRGPPSP